ncbi:hypothetical protein C2G38_2053303, partial [Gigaspora rosea]
YEHAYYIQSRTVYHHTQLGLNITKYFRYGKRRLKDGLFFRWVFLPKIILFVIYVLIFCQLKIICN